MQYNFICIEGNIGVGKTSLAKKISEDCNARLILEEFANNPFLPNFYKEPEKYAFPLELFFMAERYKQLKEVMVQEIFFPFTVSDYFFIKSRLFAQNNLSKDDSSLPKPDLLVYLHTDIKSLQKNIKKRDRSYEQDITDDYLKKIQEKYLDFFKKQMDFPVLIIDVTNVDFIQNDEKYQKIIAAIKQPYSFGVHQFSLH